MKIITITLLLLLSISCDNLRSEVNNWAQKNSIRNPQGIEAKNTSKISSHCPSGSSPDKKASTTSKKMCRTHAGTLFPASEAFQEFYPSGNPKTLLVYTGNNLLRVNWHENGRQKEEINYLDNKKEGPWRSWQENGQLKEVGTYIFGKKSGTFITYHDNGAIKEEAKYHNDQKNGLATSYNDSSKIISRETFVNGRKHGNSEYFDEQTGTLSSHGTYSSGNYFGKWISYNQDGTRSSSGSYDEKGLKDGEWKYYDLKGVPSKTEYYAHGEISKKLELQANVGFNNGDTLGGKSPALSPKNRYKPPVQPTLIEDRKGWQAM